MNHISRELSARGREHWAIRRIPQSFSIPHPSTGWCFPNHGVIKFNCNAAVGGGFSCIAMVARNWRGEVVLALSRRVQHHDPSPKQRLRRYCGLPILLLSFVWIW
uniref:Uncharacterized protein n=1 Tax=Fagus sylvatica TaxID=28930 RepID=A0A2N9H3R0_FAGSY